MNPELRYPMNRRLDFSDPEVVGAVYDLFDALDLVPEIAALQRIGSVVLRAFELEEDYRALEFEHNSMESDYREEQARVSSMLDVVNNLGFEDEEAFHEQLREYKDRIRELEQLVGELKRKNTQLKTHVEELDW